jgi:hypothetical protein
MEKKYIKYLILCQIIAAILIASLNYIVDPLLYYQRDKRVFPILYTEEQRDLIPGLIKNSRDHNAAIIGTSLAENFRASQVSALFHEKTVKLTINGATFLEQCYVLSKYLNAHPNAKIVIWDIDTAYIDKDPEDFINREFITEDFKYPFYLYNNNTLNFQYLLNYKVTLHSFQTVANDFLGIKFISKTRDLDRIHTWPRFIQTGCEHVMDNYNKFSVRYSDLLDQVYNKINAIANLNKITDITQRYKNVQFYMLLPPYSIVRYKFEVEHNGLERLLESRNLFAEKTRGISNIKIIDLQASEDIISNLDYYKDMSHYNGTVVDIILNNIVKENSSGYESILENTKKLRKLVETFDFGKVRKCEP